MDLFISNTNIKDVPITVLVGESERERDGVWERDGCGDTQGALLYNIIILFQIGCQNPPFIIRKGKGREALDVFSACFTSSNPGT